MVKCGDKYFNLSSHENVKYNFMEIKETNDKFKWRVAAATRQWGGNTIVGLGGGGSRE